MEKRRQEILDMINQAGEIDFSVLKQNFPEVSEVTLRKDLRYLDSTMQIVRIHGGAKSLPAAIGSVDNFYTRSSKHVDEKKLIGEKAATLLTPHQSLFIASGSTCTEVAKALPAIPLHVFTDGLITALELSKFSHIETTILGGEIDTSAVRATGPRLFDELNQLHFDIAFLGTDGYRPGYGFVYCSTHSAALLQILSRQSDKVAVLMDHSKVDAVRAARNIPAKQADIVITDGKLSDAAMKSLLQAGVSVL